MTCLGVDAFLLVVCHLAFACQATSLLQLVVVVFDAFLDYQSMEQLAQTTKTISRVSAIAQKRNSHLVFFRHIVVECPWILPIVSGGTFKSVRCAMNVELEQEPNRSVLGSASQFGRSEPAAGQMTEPNFLNSSRDSCSSTVEARISVFGFSVYLRAMVLMSARSSWMIGLSAWTRK